MKLNVCARFLTLVAVALLVQVATLAQPSSGSRAPGGQPPANSSFGLRASEFPGLHPCGLIREDPRTVPWMVQDKVIQDELAPGAPACLSVSVDLSGQMPPVGNQGIQGSCTAWAVGYYQKTHYEWREHNWNDSTANHQYSPAFIYNQIDGGADSGSSTSDAFALITDQGCATLADCPYNQNDYTTWPSESAYSRAIPYRGGAAHWFWMTDTNGVKQAKQRLDSGYTTVIGIEVYGNFDTIQNYGYKYCVADTHAGTYRGSHAVTIVGYNDTLTTHDGAGAFRMINSWGTGWGQSGYFWMSYVAARDAGLSHQVGYYLDDLIGYSPTMLGRVKITHSARDKIGIRLGVGRPSSPNWTKDFRIWRDPKIDRAFPSNNLVFDMTGGEPYITNSTTDTVFVRAIDDAADAKTGTINHFAATHLAWSVTGTSSDTPVSIPDYNVGVHARARILHTDVGVTQITAPTGTVDSGTTIMPKARVRNYGSANASFPVTFKIGSFYNNSQAVTNLAAGDSVLVSFTNWIATQRGTHVTRCSTALAGDQSHANDTLPGSVAVRVTNVGVTTIVAPTGTIDSGTVVTPRARVRNCGTGAATFPFYFKIGSFYSNSQTVTNLAAGDSVLVSFTNWTAAQRGTHAARCSTALSGDQVFSNDTLSVSVTVRVTNVGVTTIVAPTGTIDSGTVVTPRARVRNYGTGAATFPVYLKIGSFYSNSQTVTNLAAGDSALVSFTNWTATQRGTHATRCSTALSGDQNHANDTLSGSVMVRVINVGVTAIVAPTGTVDSSTTIAPQARVKNYGTAAATFPIHFKIGSFYSNTQTITNLAAGDSALVSFTNWTATQRGTHATCCSAAVSGDQVHSNDTLSGSVTVRVTNVGVTAIVAPTGTLDSGTTVTPQARVKNYGTGAATFPTTFRVGSFYANTQTVTNLAAGDSALVSFTAWTAFQRGTHATRCSTALAGDPVHINDTLSGSVAVRVTNVGVSAIVAPTDTVDSGTTITPQARVRNYGTSAASFPATFVIGSFYSNTQTVASLAAGDSALVSFAAWTALQFGTHVKRCSTGLANDQVHTNDTLSGLVTVVPPPNLDVGVTTIVAPAGMLDSGAIVTPQARVRNYGTSAASFPVTFLIGSFYSNTQTVSSLGAGDSVLVSFANWTALQRGTHVTRCSTALAGDEDHANDTLSGSVGVRVTNVGVTAVVAPTGTIDSGAAVTPKTRVRNYGNTVVTFPVTMSIGADLKSRRSTGTFAATVPVGMPTDRSSASARVNRTGVGSYLSPISLIPDYTNTQTVTNLAPGDSIEVSFASWTASPRGLLSVRCSTDLENDQVHTNDTLSGAVIVQVLNVGVTAIVAPTDTADSGAAANPQARVRNFGTGAASFPVVFRIGAYADTQSVAGLAAGESALVSFATWTATVRGENATRCSTALTGDNDHANDTLLGAVTVRVRDIACTRLLAPRDTVDSGATVVPRAVIENLGTTPETFDVRFAVGAGYADTVSVTLTVGQTDTLDFAVWTALTLGTFPSLCATMLPTDTDPANDSLLDSVVVKTYSGVAELQALPKILALERPRPDPMRGHAAIRFSIPHRAQASVSIRSATGALVRILSGPRSLAPDAYSLSWDGCDERGRRVAPGIYFWRLEFDGTALTRKTVKID